jgi:hypothetical protein
VARAARPGQPCVPSRSSFSITLACDAGSNAGAYSVPCPQRLRVSVVHGPASFFRTTRLSFAMTVPLSGAALVRLFVPRFGVISR